MQQREDDDCVFVALSTWSLGDESITQKGGGGVWKNSEICSAETLQPPVHAHFGMTWSKTEKGILTACARRGEELEIFSDFDLSG